MPRARSFAVTSPSSLTLHDDEIHAPWQLDAELQRMRGVVIGRDYPAPIVDHAIAREQALALFKSARTA